MADISDISHFFTNRSVLVTGGTGFLGKVLLEKLLRACPNIGTVFVLIRPHGSSYGEKRLQSMLRLKVFERVLSEHPQAVSTLRAIEGHVNTPCLGLSPEDRADILENVSVVFHCAASVRFDDHVAKAIGNNMGGVRNVINLCRDMPQLVALIHVSTAYANCDRKFIDEVIYPVKIPLCDIAECLKHVEGNAVDEATERLLLQGKPNGYIISKALSELVVSEEGHGLPISIVRPSMVCPSYQEPIHGWFDNLYGPFGVAVLVCTGLARVVCAHFGRVADFVPVDMTANMVIAAAWHTAKNKPKVPVVYNYTSGGSNPVQWGDSVYWCKKGARTNPLEATAWYPDVMSASGPLTWKFFNYAVNFPLASLLDFLCKVGGYKPKFVRLMQKTTKAFESVSYFSVQDWQFANSNVTSLWESLSVADKTLFPFDIKAVNWANQFYRTSIFVKKYLLKESLNKLPEARRKSSLLRAVYYFVKLILLIVVMLLTYCFFCNDTIV